MSDHRLVQTDDIFDIACYAYVIQAQDRPEPAEVYANRILNLAFAYLNANDRQDLDSYLAEKKYLPPAPPIQIVS